MTHPPPSPAPRPDGSVRLAWAADADAIAEVQVAALQMLQHALVPGAPQVDLSETSGAWRAAIVRPPSARHRVLVALAADQVVGLAATAPAEDPDADPAIDGEMVALHVDPRHTGQGHGSRLVAACADTLRADGFRRAYVWLLADDDAQRAFLGSAGWAPDGAHREVETAATGAGSAPLRMVRLHTDLGEGAA